jgi:hypothetical protein
MSIWSWGRRIRGDRGIGCLEDKVTEGGAEVESLKDGIGIAGARVRMGWEMGGQQRTRCCQTVRWMSGRT